jgi:hypothetical protein
MKKIIFVIMSVSNILFAIEKQTAWEIYAQNPTTENANRVEVLELTNKNDIKKYYEYLDILDKEIRSYHQASVELAMKRLKNGGLGGGSYSFFTISVASIVKKEPFMYLDALANVGANQCFGISNLGEEFVDRFKEQAEELRLRKKALERLSNSYLKSLCINELQISIKEATRIAQENEVSKNKCLLEIEKERIENRSNKLTIRDTVNFIQCGEDKTPLEEYVCKDDELLWMFKVLTQAEIYAYENATKTEVNHKTYAKEYGLAERTIEDNFNGDWSIKSYRNNGKVNKKQLCYDLKINTNYNSGLQIYTDEDIARINYTPKFADYPPKTTYTNPNKPLIQKGFGRLYRTLLKKALKEKKPEFAGKHIIAQWGCDEGKNECITGGIIDASTGKATEFPFKQYEYNGAKEIIYKLDSSLIIFAGDFEFKDGRKEKNKVLFYEFKNGEFLFLNSKSYEK